MAATAENGSDPGQGASATQTGDAGGDTAGGDSAADLKAQIEELQDTVGELRNAIISSRQAGASAAPVVEDDDNEPLTPSKVRKIVQSSVANVAANNQNLSQRQIWDDKAKSEFPLSDPKFRVEFKKMWRDQVASGLDPNHPRAVHNVAQLTARHIGVVKKPEKDAMTTQTSEAATAAAAPRSRQGSQAKIADNDPRLAFYQMKGKQSPEKLEALKKKLAARDEEGRSRK